MKLYIKYMVTRRCKMLVQEALKKQGLRHIFLDCGTLEILGDITKRQREQLSIDLRRSGMELLDNKEGLLIEKIKREIIKMTQRSDKLLKIDYTDYISKKLGHDYSYLNNLFAEVNGITIKQFIIHQEIGIIKEFLLYGKLTLTQIANILHCSVAQLSNQFKKITGLSPSSYRQLKQRAEHDLESM